MKMRNLESYGIPSYIVNIWEKNYSHCLMPVQERAVKDYGVLDYKENTRLPRRFAPRNDIGGTRNDINNNLLVVAPTSSGKTFIGEMAAVTQAINNKKTIYLVPLRTLAEEKYRRF
jgi:helicase